MTEPAKNENHVSDGNHEKNVRSENQTNLDRSQQSHTSHSSHQSHSVAFPRLLQPRGDYQTLLSFQKAEVVYDITYRFAHKFLAKGDRTIDQMVQSARSGKQNILEGSKAAMTSKETEIKLTNSVEQASKNCWPIIETTFVFEIFHFGIKTPRNRNSFENLVEKHRNRSNYIARSWNRVLMRSSPTSLFVLSIKPIIYWTSKSRLSKGNLSNKAVSENV